MNSQAPVVPPSQRCPVCGRRLEVDTDRCEGVVMEMSEICPTRHYGYQYSQGGTSIWVGSREWTQHYTESLTERRRVDDEVREAIDFAKRHPWVFRMKILYTQVTYWIAFQWHIRFAKDTSGFDAKTTTPQS